MTKLLITGHTSSIGSDLIKVYADYIGISRSTGFNLESASDLEKVVELSKDVDHVINLANVGKSQSDILWGVYNYWASIGKAGKIISFGTLATDVSYQLLKKIPIDMTMLGHKLALEKMHQELAFRTPFGKQPQSVLLRFANYGSRQGERSNEPFTTAEQIIKILDFVLSSDFYISTIDFREV